MNDNLCLSGGAKGADLQFGMTAGKLGHSVFHFSFKGHKTDAPSEEVVILSQDQLDMADKYCEKAAESLYRPFKTCKPYVKNLLRRNWYQVKDSEKVYAVASLSNDQVSGGTAWACQMFIDQTDIHHRELYLFNQKESKWYRHKNNSWLITTEIPEPSGIWAGIGSRDLTEDGKNAIRKLMRYND